VLHGVSKDGVQPPGERVSTSNLDAEFAGRIRCGLEKPEEIFARPRGDEFRGQIPDIRQPRRLILEPESAPSALTD
jgi:hypothetical protein